MKALMQINTWANKCGYFFNAYLTPADPRDESFYPEKTPSPNNGYNCRHLGCEREEYGIGCCHSWACPLAYEADEEDCSAFGVEYEDGEFVIVEIEEVNFDDNCMWRLNESEVQP